MNAIELLSQYKGPTLLLALLLFFIVERMYPATALRGGLERVLRNLGLALINFALSPLIVIPMTVYLAGFAPQWRSDFMSWMILDLLILDCWIYWWHRINHIMPFLWRFHEVHHLDETLDATSAVRFHFGEVLLSSLVRVLVVMLLNVPLGTVIVFETILALAAMFHHSNIKLPVRLERALAKVIVTPSIHWVHHHAVQKDTDSNYATILSVWDRLFASVSPTVRAAEMKIGVEGRREKTFTELILSPFKW